MMVIRMIWSFWEGLAAKASICHNVKLMLVSTGSHFPLLARRNAGWAHFKGIQGLFMLVPHIIVLICFNQSEPRGVREYIYSVWVPL